ncbi:hypothetical protein GGR55DRAFT_641262 [Xylaria sp. FL0064]|nr:hypothetical protein GGR55DRAFT_641262 [Xylaria sp. FL0064]
MTDTKGPVRNLKSSARRQSSTYDEIPSLNVHDDEEPTSSTQIPWARRSSFQYRTLILRITVILVILLVVSLAIIGSLRPIPRQSEQDPKPCGHNPSEARNAGCRFEPMMSAWVPEECSFSELIEDNAGTFENWLFFADEGIKQPITGGALEAVRVGNYTKIFSSHGTAHDLHCLYAWRKLNFAVERGAKFIDTKSRSLHHTTHCAKHIAQLLEEGAGYLPKDDGIRKVTAFPLLFLSCVRLT